MQTFKKGLIFSAVILLITRCATNATAPSAELDKVRDNDAIAKVLEEGQTRPRRSSSSEDRRSASEIENMTIDEVIRIEEPNTANLYDDSRYDFPITMNSRVEGWIDYFTGRGRDHMERYLSRSSRYLPLMKQVFKRAGLPEDLVYLALIESGFNLRAKSRARAVGPWQFMKATGKRYGLRVDAWIDERRDPIRSTEAAANYLKDLYLMFESWYLAASAYNAGEYKILRAIETTKTNNFWRICETKTIRRETKDYIPKLIAAAIIGKNAKKYGFGNVAYQEPLTFDTVEVDYAVKIKDVAKIVDAAEDDLLDLNPHYMRGMTPPSGGTYQIRIPTGTRTVVERTLASKQGKVEHAELPQQYTVRAGDTLNSVARRYRLAVKDLANSNNLSPREKIQPGSMLLIPTGAKQSAQKAEMVPVRNRKTASVPEEVSKEADAAGFIIHTVKSGESLWSISEQYNVTVQNIFRWNNLRRSSIHPGKKLKIKAANNSAKASKSNQS